MRAAEAEVDESSAGCRVDAAGSLGREQRLEVDLVEQDRFDQLRCSRAASTTVRGRRPRRGSTRRIGSTSHRSRTSRARPNREACEVDWRFALRARHSRYLRRPPVFRATAATGPTSASQKWTNCSRSNSAKGHSSPPGQWAESWQRASRARPASRSRKSRCATAARDESP